MLHKHLIDGRLADVWVQSSLAEGEEVVEGGLKLLVALVGRGEDAEQALGQLGDLGLELVHRLVEAVDLRFGVGVELVEEGGQLLRVGQVEPVALLAALEQHRPAGVLENGVGQRVALGDLLLNLGVEVVVGVLGLPEAAAHVEQVAQGAVGSDAALADLEPLLGDELPAVRLGRFFQQAPEGGFKGAFVRHLVVAVALQGGVVLLDGLVRRFDRRSLGHGQWTSQRDRAASAF